MRGFRLTWAACLCVLSLQAADIVVAGRTIDENEAGIEGAEITVRDAAGMEQRATTDATGGFKVRLPAEGKYLFSASQVQYLTVKDLALDVHEGMPPVDLTLNHAKEVLQTVDVKASPQPIDIEATQSEREVSGLQIMDVPYPSTHSLLRAMQLIPGQVADNSGRVHFDGGRENQTNFLLDGFNVGDPLSGILNTTVSVESVSSLDFLSGRYSPEFGQGSAGTLQIKTQTGDDTVRYSATDFIPGLNTQEGLHLGAWTPRVNLSGPIAKGRAWFSDNLDADYNVTVVQGLPSNENTTSALQASNLLHTQVNITPTNILYTDFLFNYNRQTEFGLSVLTPPSTTLDDRGRNWFLGLKDQIYLARGTLLELGFAEMFTLARQIPQGDGIYIINPNTKAGYNFLNSTQHSRRGQFLTNLYLPSWRFAGKHQFKLGTDVDRVDYSQGITRTGYDLYGLRQNLLRSVRFEGDGTLSRPTLTASSYVVDHWQLRRNLFLEIGLREDWDEILRRVEWSPRAAFSWSPWESGKTRFSGGYAAVYDPTILQLFTLPMDQYTLTNMYSASGALTLPNALTLFEIKHPDRLKGALFHNESLGVDHEFGHRISAGLSFQRKRGGDGLAYIRTLPAPILATPQIAETYHASYVQQIYSLTNIRHDSYDAAQLIVHQSIGGRYEWMASYTRSRATSNQVIEPTLEQTLLLGPNNTGPMPWDTPNRFLSWGYLPTFWKDWAVAYLFEQRTGFPFSVQDPNGRINGSPDSQRYPDYFNINLHIEWRTHLGKYRFAIRGGMNNVTNHSNYTVVDNTLGSPLFRTFYGVDGRHFVARIRWLGKE